MKMEYNILDYGAVPDGKTLNTPRIQRAIDEANIMTPQSSFLKEHSFLGQYI